MMHLGPRVGALVDGQLGDAESERAWSHVHTCATCRAAVEREGWIKRQLVGLALADDGEAPAALKGSLCSPGVFARYPDHSDFDGHEARGRRFGGLAAIGAGTVGAAMFGVLAFSAAPAQAPTIERRVPPASLLSTQAATPTSRPTNVRVTNREVAHVMESVLAPWKLGL